MDRIINILLLVIIFVFDPLAISLVIAANFAFDIANRKNLYGEVEEETPPPFTDLYTEEDEKRMDIIGRNGNDGEHYDKDWEVVEEEIVQPDDNPKEKIVERILMKGPSRNPVVQSGRIRPSIMALESSNF